MRFYRSTYVGCRVPHLVAIEIGTTRHGVRFELQLRSFQDDARYVRFAFRTF